MSGNARYGIIVRSSRVNPKFALTGSIASTCNSTCPAVVTGTLPEYVFTTPAYCMGTSTSTLPSRTSRATTRNLFESQWPPGSVGDPQALLTVAFTSNGDPTLTLEPSWGARVLTMTP